MEEQWAAKRDRGGPKAAQKGTKMAQVELRRGSLGPKGSLQGAKRHPRGPHGDPKGNPKGLKGTRWDAKRAEKWDRTEVRNC